MMIFTEDCVDKNSKGNNRARKIVYKKTTISQYASYSHLYFTYNYPRFERFFRSFLKVFFKHEKDGTAFVFTTYSS